MSSRIPENSYPTPENPYYHTGKYERGDTLLVSPEGNRYAQTRFVAKLEHKLWWTGSGYRYVKYDWMHISTAELPIGQSPFGEIRAVREYIAAENKYVWAEYWYDSEKSEWKKLRWLWTVDGFPNLPEPGMQVGAAHIVIERDVPMFWDGEKWTRWKHSWFEDDEPERHLPKGLLQFLAPDVELTWINSQEIAVSKAANGTGQVWINGEWVKAKATASAFSSLPSLEWDSQDKTLVEAPLEPDTEYWIYWANTKDPVFGRSTWDFRGKLFLSRTPDYNGYLADSGAGRKARLAGKIQTDSNSPPGFLRELNISLISNQPNFAESLRDFSDFVVEFVDEDTLSLSQLDGAYGQIYVATQLYYLGTSKLFSRNDPFITWNSGTDDKIDLVSGPLAANTTYYLYLPASIDPFNFNTINPDTNRPWQEEDEGSGTYYDPDLDYRLRPFFCTKVPDGGRLSEEWPGYYTRHIGQITTDDNGRLVNALNISFIRQPGLSPTFFDGLAEIYFAPLSETELQVTRKQGTSGIVIVGGTPVQTYEKFAQGVHRVRTSDTVYVYKESDINDPLMAGPTLAERPEQDSYLYLANDRPCWGALANRTFLSMQPPTNGYLSRNWPGTNARWLATLVPDANGRLTGSYFVEGLALGSVTINDHDISLNDTWSSSKIDAELNIIRARLDFNEAFDNQNSAGCLLRLQYVDTITVYLNPLSSSVQVLFPDTTILTLTDGITFDASGGTPGTVHYLYLDTTGALSRSTTPPDTTYEKAHYLGTDKILVGYLAPAPLEGEWSICSFWNEPEKTWFFFPEAETYQEILIPPWEARTFTENGIVPNIVVPPGRATNLTLVSQPCVSTRSKYNDTGDWIDGYGGTKCLTPTDYIEWGIEYETWFYSFAATIAPSLGALSAGAYDITLDLSCVVDTEGVAKNRVGVFFTNLDGIVVVREAS